MIHSMRLDKDGIAVGWFTICGKHVVVQLPKTDSIGTHPDCPKCLKGLE